MEKSFHVIVNTDLNSRIDYRQPGDPVQKGDLARFREMTIGNVVIMGRHTYAALPKGLRDRNVIVVSSTHGEILEVAEDLARSNYYEGEIKEGTYFVKSLTDALILAHRRLPGDKIFVAGGLSLYKAALQFPCTVHLTMGCGPSKKEQTEKLNFTDFITLCSESVWLPGLMTGELTLSHTYHTLRSPIVPPRLTV